MKNLISMFVISLIISPVQFAPMQAAQEQKAFYSSPVEKPAELSEKILTKREIAEKFDLWRGDKTLLRGANTWQKLKDGRIEPIYVPSDFTDLAARKANLVNISHPGTYGEEARRGATRGDREKRYRLEAASMNNMKQMVQLAENANLFSVIALRTGPERREKIFDEQNPSPSKLWSEPAAQDAWAEMWRETALALKDFKTVVGYDLMVEPDPVSPAQWNLLAKKIIAAIRSVDPKTPIIVEPANGGSIDSLRNLDPQELDPNNNLKIVYAVHNYEPTDYAQQAEGKFIFKCNERRENKKGQPKSDQYIAYDNTQRNKLKEQYTALAVWRREHGGVPLIVNEFGVVRWAGGWRNNTAQPDADAFMEEQINLIENLGISHAVWKWDPRDCLGDDDFNFRNGQIFDGHKDTSSELYRKIILSWERNEIYPKDINDKF